MDMDQAASDANQMRYQSEAFQELAHIIQTKKIPNALLFSGHANTGRKEAALAFAKGCNCKYLEKKGIFCGQCASCMKIDHFSHPDMIYLDPPEGKNIITISRIRELGDTLASRPNEAAYRMVMISQAEAMNVQAQNALLKMLEEPPQTTFFILLSVKTDLLLPTIVSRCRTIRFKPLSSKTIAQRLIKEYQIDPGLARIASETLDSDLNAILTRLRPPQDKKSGAKENSSWIKKREWLLKNLTAMIQSKQDPLPRGLMLSQKLSGDPEFMPDALSILKTFFRDLLVFTIHPEKIVNLDFFDSFAHITRMMQKDRFFEWSQHLYESEKKINANCNPRLTLDNFFLKMSGNERDVCI